MRTGFLGFIILNTKHIIKNFQNNVVNISNFDKPLFSALPAWRRLALPDLRPWALHLEDARGLGGLANLLQARFGDVGSGVFGGL